MGQILQKNEKIITIDDLLISHSFISELDQAKAHFDYRNVYSKEMGEALANKVDQHLLQLVCLAARAAETTSGTGGGNEIVDADAATNADSLVASIFEASEDLDSNNVPESDRFVVVSPNIYYNIVQSDKILNRDFGGANGVYADGTVLKVAGMNIVKSNTATTAFANHSSDSTTGTNNTYNVAAQATVAVCFHKSCVGTVKLKDLKMESDYDIRRQGTLLLGKLAYGHGILRPESAVEITTS